MQSSWCQRALCLPSLLFGQGKTIHWDTTRHCGLTHTLLLNICYCNCNKPVTMWPDESVNEAKFWNQMIIELKHYCPKITRAPVSFVWISITHCSINRPISPCLSSSWHISILLIHGGDSVGCFDEGDQDCFVRRCEGQSLICAGRIYHCMLGIDLYPSPGLLHTRPHPLFLLGVLYSTEWYWPLIPVPDVQ